MIIAMPMSRGKLASHFTKAQRIGFFNEYHQLITSFDNPALAGGCSAKKAMLQLIAQQKTDIVIVQHIGERMLGKLLDAQISVSKGDHCESIEALLTTATDLNRRLVDASQGRSSLNHKKKGGCCSSSGGCASSEASSEASSDGCAGGCGCSHTHKADESSSRMLDKQHQSTVLADKPVSYSGFRTAN